MFRAGMRIPLDNESANPYSSYREAKAEDSATYGRIRRRERAAVIRDDAMRKCEADAVPLRFGGEEGNEDALQIRLREPAAGIADLYAGPLFGARLLNTRAANRDAPRSLLFVYGFGGVAQKVKERLSQHGLVGLNGGEVAFCDQRNAALIVKRL